METALAALNEDNSTDLEETDVQEILLAYDKESRQLRGEQRVKRGYRPVTRRTSGGKSLTELRVDSTSRNFSRLEMTAAASCP